MRIEDVLKELRREMTIVLVTNLVQQARRLADRTMFLWNGEMRRGRPTEVVFSGEVPGPAHAGLRQRDLRMSAAHRTDRDGAASTRA
jgi:ABC-type glutathione transport system ATPase component